MMASNSAVRLPAKEAELVRILRERPSSLDELRALPLVRRKIGRGYVGPILKCLLDEQTIAVTNGIFWVRPAKLGQKFECPKCGLKHASPGLCDGCYGDFR
jgi:hypothetical protein